MIRFGWLPRGALRAASICLPLLVVTATARAQTPPGAIVRVDMSTGRSYPIQSAVAVTNVAVSNPEVADVAVIGQRDVVINGRSTGETDVILFLSDDTRRHYRVAVRSSTTDRQQVVLGVKIAELRKDVLRQFGVSVRARDFNTDGLVRAGQGRFRTDDPFTADGSIAIDNANFFTLLTQLDGERLTALIEAEEQRGTARILAEPSLAVADRDSASFLAGGEIPIPIPQQGGAGMTTVTIMFKEFGVRLNFRPEILNDTLIKLAVEPEVSSLDYGNAIEIQGFRIPAFRTRRVQSTVDVRRNQSLVISGLFNNEREKVRVGIPFLSQIPVLGALFGSTRWLNSETELVVVVTPVVYDPRRPRLQDSPHFPPDTATPALEVLGDRLGPVAIPILGPPAGQPAAPPPAPSAPATPSSRPPQPRQR